MVAFILYKHLFIKKGKTPHSPREDLQWYRRTSIFHFPASLLHVGEDVVHNPFSQCQGKDMQTKKEVPDVKFYKMPTDSHPRLKIYTHFHCRQSWEECEVCCCWWRTSQSEQKRTSTPGKENFSSNKWGNANEMKFTFKSQSHWDWNLIKIKKALGNKAIWSSQLLHSCVSVRMK